MARQMRRLYENTGDDCTTVKQFISFPDGDYWQVLKDHYLGHLSIIRREAEKSISQIKSILNRYIDADISFSSIDLNRWHSKRYIEITFMSPGVTEESISEDTQDAIWDAMPQDELNFGIMNIRVHEVTFDNEVIVVGCTAEFK